LHGSKERYRKLFDLIASEQPDIVFIGGDIMPGGTGIYALDFEHTDFINDLIAIQLQELKSHLGDKYPEIFVILGNDDGRSPEPALLDLAVRKLLKYIHQRRIRLGEFSIYGYAYIPPSPLQLKDWERYDVSRFVDPGALSPELGQYSFPVSDRDKKFATIAEDLKNLIMDDDLTRAIFLFHSPPYQTSLDRAALDGKFIDHVPLDVHVGSIAIKRMIEQKQPLLTLHGHVHESTSITGLWKENIGRTICLSAAHNGPELAVIRFDLNNPEEATRQLL